MTSTLPLDKSTLVKLLTPVSQLTEKCVLKLTDTKMYTLAATADTNIVLYASVPLSASLKDVQRVNISDVKKLLTGIDCFEEDLSFTLNDNHLLCSTVSLNGEFFKFFLVDDAVIKEYPININKITSLNFNTTFEINRKKLSEITRGSSYARSTQKIYFYCKNDIIYAELNDFSYQNVDNITFLVTDKHEGDKITSMLPLDLEIFRILNSLKCESVKVKINNENKVVMFSVNDGEVELKYIISTLTK